MQIVRTNELVGKTIRILPSASPRPAVRYQNPIAVFNKFNWLYEIVIRGQESEGVKIWSCSDYVHKIINQCILEGFVKVDRYIDEFYPAWWKYGGRFLRRLLWRKPNMRPVYYSILDWQSGKDFQVRSKIRPLSYGSHEVVDYSPSDFVTDSSPLLYDRDEALALLDRRNTFTQWDEIVKSLEHPPTPVNKDVVSVPSAELVEKHPELAKTLSEPAPAIPTPNFSDMMSTDNLQKEQATLETQANRQDDPITAEIKAECDRAFFDAIKIKPVDAENANLIEAIKDPTHISDLAYQYIHEKLGIDPEQLPKAVHHWVVEEIGCTKKYNLYKSPDNKSPVMSNEFWTVMNKYVQSNAQEGDTIEFRNFLLGETQKAKIFRINKIKGYDPTNCGVELQEYKSLAENSQPRGSDLSPSEWKTVEYMLPRPRKGDKFEVIRNRVSCDDFSGRWLVPGDIITADKFVYKAWTELGTLPTIGISFREGYMRYIPFEDLKPVIETPATVTA